MSTATPHTSIDPQNSTMKTSLQRLEQKLRWISPLLLGFFQTITPYSYRVFKGLSTAIGYLLFFIPTILIGSILTDYYLGNQLLTTATVLLFELPALTLQQLFIAPLVTLAVGLGLYTILLFDYTPVEPNSTSVREPYQWQLLILSLLGTPPLLIGTTIVFGLSSTYTTSVLIFTSWWVTRRLTFTTIWDQTRYLVNPPYEIVLVTARVPFFLGVGLVLLTSVSVFTTGLLLTPFMISVGYLYWRRLAEDDTSQDLRDKRMYEKSGVPEEYLDKHGSSNGYQAFGQEKRFREVVRKFNSFLDTEIDTERRVELSDSVLSEEELSQATQEARNIYTDFVDVSYRPERFEDIIKQIESYGEEIQELKN